MRVDLYLDRYKKKLEDAIRSRGDAMPPFSRELFCSYYQTGLRLDYERLYFKRREWFTTQALWVLLGLTEDVNRDVELLLEIMKDIVKELTWMLPAHASLDHLEGKCYDIDLFAAETAGSMAEVLYRMEGLVPELLRNTYEEVKELFFEAWKIKIRGPWERANPCAWWEYGNMNWTSVCCGNIALAAHYLEQMGYEVHGNATMERVAQSMRSYLSAMGKEGVCTEGVGYYKYGMQYFLAFHEIVRERNRDKIDDIIQFKPLASYLTNMYLGNGQFVCFSDSQIKHTMPLGMLSYLSSCFKEEALLPKDFAPKGELILDEKAEILGGDECHRFAGALRDYLWVKEYGESLHIKEDNSNTVIYKEQMWYLNKGEITFGIKGGHNDEPHNHNDVGSFFCLIDGKELFVDLGAGAYTKDYFGEKRYETLCTRSLGHNVPLLCGEEQLAGKEYGASDFTATKNQVQMKLGKAYGKENHSLVRSVFFETDGTVKMEDYAKGMFTEVFLFREEPKLILKTNHKQGQVLNSNDEMIWELEQPNAAVVFHGGGDAKIEKLEHIEHDGTPVNIWRLRIGPMNGKFSLKIGKK